MDIGCCFREPPHDNNGKGERFKGCGLNSTKCGCMTCNTPKVERELDAKIIQFPLVGDLMGRTSCCCWHLGCNCDTGTCIGIGSQVSCCCCLQNCHIALQTKDDKYGRALCRCIGADMCFGCEDGCTIHESSRKVLCLCCIEEDITTSIKCCPNPFRCYQNRCHFCCCYGKCNCPCSIEVPCEVGLCGIYCMKKVEQIEEFQNKHPEDFYGMARITPSGANGEVEVVKGGAPTNNDEMIRE